MDTTKQQIKMYKTGVANQQIMVSLANSKRLTAMREKADLATGKVAVQNPAKIADGLNQQSKDALQQAWQLAEHRMSEILNSYPAGKKETFFKLKHGINSDKIKTLPMKQIFQRLKLDQSSVKHFRLIESLDYLGNKL